MTLRKVAMPWRKRSGVPPLSDEWLVSLLGYRFYAAGQIVDLPTRDSLIISWAEGAQRGTVLRDTLVDDSGREVLPDYEVDWLEKSLEALCAKEKDNGHDISSRLHEMQGAHLGGAARGWFR